MNGIVALEQNLRQEMLDKLAPMDDKELLQAIRDAFRVTIKDILWLGLLVYEAKKRGKELQDMALNGLVDEYHKVGCGQVMAAVLHRFWLKPAARKRISQLPIPVQAKFVEEETARVPVRVPGANGHDETQLMDPINMSVQVLAQVFDGPTVRDEEAQAGYLVDKKRKALLPKRQVPGWDQDEARRLFKKGRWTVTYDEVQAMYKAIK